MIRYQKFVRLNFHV